MTTEKKQKRIGEIMVGFDLKDNDSYAGVKDIYHAVGRTSRTASEAFKDADYATPIWRCSTDFDRGVFFIKEAFVGFCGVALAICGVVSLVMWISK